MVIRKGRKNEERISKAHSFGAFFLKKIKLQNEFGDTGPEEDNQEQAPHLPPWARAPPVTTSRMW